MSIDPLFILSTTFIQIGARYLDFDLTPIQKKLLKSKVIQTIILFCIIYMSTRDIIKSFVIIIFLYLCIYVLFNENHEYNIISNFILEQEGIIDKHNIKELYYDNIISLLN